MEAPRGLNNPGYCLLQKPNYSQNFLQLKVAERQPSHSTLRQEPGAWVSPCPPNTFFPGQFWSSIESSQCPGFQSPSCVRRWAQLYLLGITWPYTKFWLLSYWWGNISRPQSYIITLHPTLLVLLAVDGPMWKWDLVYSLGLSLQSPRSQESTTILAQPGSRGGFLMQIMFIHQGFKLLLIWPFYRGLCTMGDPTRSWCSKQRSSQDQGTLFSPMENFEIMSN